MLVRVTRTRPPRRNSVSVPAGRIRCSHVPMPEEGSQRSRTANSRMLITPTQNTGVDWPIRASEVTTVSHAVSRLTAVSTPNGTPSATAAATARPASVSVAGSRSRTKPSAGSRSWMEAPKSSRSACDRKRSVAHRQRIVETHRGAEAGDLGCAGVGRKQQSHRVARQVHHREDQQRQPQQDHHAECEAAGQIPEHAGQPTRRVGPHDRARCLRAPGPSRPARARRV